MIELPRHFLGMPRQECLFLETLINAIKPYISHDEMTAAISGKAPDETRISQVIACKLRKRLEESFDDTSIIETVWGRGYRLADGARDLILQAAGFDVREAA